MENVAQKYLNFKHLFHQTKEGGSNTVAEKVSRSPTPTPITEMHQIFKGDVTPRFVRLHHEEQTLNFHQ